MSDFNKRYLDFCGPFVTSLKEVYKVMAQADLEHEKPIIRKDEKVNAFYSSIIAISGTFSNGDGEQEYKGTMSISWTKESYLGLASSMMMEEFADFNDEIKDLGMEIANMTVGSAKKVLKPKGYSIEMSIPTSVIGEEHHVDVKKDVVTIVIPLKSTHGDLYMEVNYSDQIE